MKKYLWVYQELEGGAMNLYTTFLTEVEAANCFSGKHAYKRLTADDIRNGLLP